VTPEHWFPKAKSFAEHPAWPRTKRVLADLLSVQDTSSIGIPDLENAVKIFSAEPSLLAGKRMAIVAQKEFDKARQFGQLMGRFGMSVLVFTNLDTACTFLGLDTAYAYPMLADLHKQLDGE
jgi:SpoU rRNA methylase family enzyme